MPRANAGYDALFRIVLVIVLVLVLGFLFVFEDEDEDEDDFCNVRFLPDTNEIVDAPFPWREYFLALTENEQGFKLPPQSETGKYEN